MTRLRSVQLLCCLALVVQCALIASAAGFAALADVTGRADPSSARTWHEPLRYLTLATRLDPLESDYPALRGQVALLLADRTPAQRDAHHEVARQSYASALERSPGDGILWARQVALLLELGDHAEASAALEHVLVWAPFEPPAHRIMVAAAADHWIRLDAAARTRVLTLSGNALLQASERVPEHAGATVAAYGLLPMTCAHLARRGSAPHACLASRGSTGAD